MTMHGIDISGWQAGIDLGAVPADFVIMKATGGVSYVSSDCDRQYQQAKALGKLRGVYHFANDDSLGSSAIAEADFFVANTLGYHDGETILVLDFEAQALPLGPGWALAFMQRVQERTGIKPVLYLMGSEAAQAKWDPVVREDFGLWLAHWTVSGATGHVVPPAPMGTRWPFVAIHQYSEKGRLPGYDGDLDLNVSSLDRAAWMKYAAKNGEAKPAPAPPAPAPPAPPVAPTPPPTSTVNYVVVAGDTLSGLAGRFGTTVGALQSLNNIADPNRIYAGQTLRVPGRAGRTYTVQRGDTLSGIADRFGVSWGALQEVNGIADPNLIYPGTELVIP